MNRQQRRAAGVKSRTSAIGPAILDAAHYLANVAGPTATGATLMMPDGTCKYMSVEEACIIAATTTPTGPTQ